MTLQDMQDVQTSTDVGQVQDQQTQDVTPTDESKGVQDVTEGKDMQDELETLRRRVAELEPKKKSEEELALEQKAAELWAKEVSLTLKENQLEPFADFINATDSETLKTQIESLKAILGQYRLDSSFVPSQHKSSDKYDHALKIGDTKGAIATKLSQLFK